MNQVFTAVNLEDTKSLRLVQPSVAISDAKVSLPINQSLASVNLPKTKSLRLVQPSVANPVAKVNLSSIHCFTSAKALVTNVNKVHVPSSPVPASDPQVNRPTTHSFAALKASLTTVESLKGSSGFPQPNSP